MLANASDASHLRVFYLLKRLNGGINMYIGRMAVWSLVFKYLINFITSFLTVGLNGSIRSA